MRISLDLNWITSVLLASVRVGVPFAFSPLMTFSSVPARFRVLFILALSVTLVSVVGVPPAQPLTSFATLGAGALRELMLGGALAFGLVAGFAAFQLAGRVLDVQLGFGVAGLLDPTTKAQVPLLGTLLYMGGVVAFLSIDGHHLVIKALAFSLERTPPGIAYGGVDLRTVIVQFGAMFSFAVAIAAPAIFVLLLVDVVLAVMARSMPQMNIFLLSLPLKILIGLLTFALAIGYLAPVTGLLFESMFGYFESVVG